MFSVIRILVLCWLAVFAAFSVHAHDVPSARLAKLARGINLEGWMQVSTSVPPSDAELKRLRELGFGHVRLPVSTASLLMEPELTRKRLGEALQRLKRARLFAIVDFHPDRSQIKLMANDPRYAMGVARTLWLDLARWIDDNTSPSDVALELYNEPDMVDWLWRRELPPLVDVVRKAAPRHTLLVGGTWLNHWKSLAKMPELNDTNLVYVFHFYDPFNFTHQGAEWSGNEILKNFRQLPFPARETEAVTAMRDKFNKENMTNPAAALKLYFERNENEATIMALFDKLAVWAKERDVPLMVTEFGTTNRAIMADRAHWTRATRVAAERHSIGWTYWSYADVFGLFYRKSKQDEPLIHAALRDALGLNK